MRAFQRMEHISRAHERQKQAEQAKAERFTRLSAGLAQIQVDSELRRLVVAKKKKQQRASKSTRSSTSTENKANPPSSLTTIETVHSRQPLILSRDED